MAIKFNEANQTYQVSFHKRHPITRVPVRAARMGIKTKAEAQRVYDQLVLQVEEKLKRVVVPAWIKLVEDFCRASLERGLNRKTIENYYLCLKAHTFEIWGERTIDTITTQEIRELVLVRLANKSVSHQKSLLKFVRGVLTFAFESGLIKTNPTPQMKFRIGDKIKKVLNEVQVKQLLAKAKELNSEWYPHWALALYTGMRNGELYALTWDKVDLNQRTILVSTSWNNVDGFKETKSGDDRMLEIAPTLVTLLEQLKTQQNDSTFVLPRLDKWDKGEQARDLRMFLSGVGLPQVRFHDLRATWATIMLSKGIEPIKVMKMGGWKDIKTMMIYARKAGVDIVGITNCLNFG